MHPPLIRPGVIGLVMKLYPEPVSDRYGAEIAELLAGSTRPWHDLADVGRAALGERLAAWTWAEARPGWARFAWIATVPLWLNLGAIVAVIGPGTVINTLDTYTGNTMSDPALSLVMAISMAPVYAEAAWFGNRRARMARPAAPQVTVPAALAVGTLVVTTLPWMLLGGPPPSPVATVGTWFAALLGLGIASRGLSRRGRPGTALLVLGLGSAVALEVSGALWGLAQDRDWVSALTTWPVTLSGVGAEDFPLFGPVFTLTAATAYALPLVAARLSPSVSAPGRERRRGRGAPVPKK